MLESSFAKIYTKFKMSLYSKVFSQQEHGENTLSAAEVFCVETIYALENPTINEFAEFAAISLPNAAYKINSLVRKGYVKKTQSISDKRESILTVTDKYMENYGITYDYIDLVLSRVRKRFKPEDVKKLEEMLDVISEELMPEVKMSRKF